MLSIVEEKNIDKDKLFIFTIVRNPWERMLSMYLFYHKNNFNCPEFFSQDLDIDNDFNNWIKYIYSEKYDRSKIHSKVNIFKYCFSNQLNWVKNNDGNIIENTHIYKIEDTDLNFLFSSILKLDNFNVKKKVHPTKHSHYSNYYSDNSIKLVEKHYSDDINYFGYKFINLKKI